MDPPLMLRQLSDPTEAKPISTPVMMRQMSDPTSNRAVLKLRFPVSRMPLKDIFNQVDLPETSMFAQPVVLLADTKTELSGYTVPKLARAVFTFTVVCLL